MPAFDDLFSEDNLARIDHLIVVYYFVYAKYTNLVEDSTVSVDLWYPTKDPPELSAIKSLTGLPRQSPRACPLPRG